VCFLVHGNVESCFSKDVNISILMGLIRKCNMQPWNDSLYPFLKYLKHIKDS
jgi:hypothetical protein